MCAAMRATARPRAGLRPKLKYWPPHHSGSAMIACRPTSWKAMFCAEWRAGARGAGSGTGGKTRLWIARNPLQYLHCAHRAADHTEQALNAEMVDEAFLGTDHVANRDHRKRKGPRFASGGIDVFRPGRA